MGSQVYKSILHGYNAVITDKPVDTKKTMEREAEVSYYFAMKRASLANEKRLKGMYLNSIFSRLNLPLVAI